MNGIETIESILEQQPPRKKSKPNVPRILNGTFYSLEGEIPDDGKIEARCTECQQIRKGNVRTTGNFISHYRTTHRDKFGELELFLRRAPVSASTSVSQLRKDDSFPEINKQEVNLKNIYHL